MAETWTIRKLIDWTSQDFASRGIDSARLDAELLLAHALGMERVGLYMDLDRPLDAEELARYRASVVRRRKREPVAYIVGRRAFYGRLFSVSPAVLVPRPDTEILVDRALELLPRDERARVVDLGTGSGAIALTLAAERPTLEVVATDLSGDALAVARTNAERLGVHGRVQFVHGDLFAPLDRDRPFDLVVSNPPYIAEDEIEGLMPEVSVHEPRLALVASSEGLAMHRRLLDEGRDFVVPGGWLVFEVGVFQAPRVLEHAREVGGWTDLGVDVDLGGIERVVRARRQ